ncbi:MAG: DUF3131 domain-containing protein [Clostridia bacterium]|nr:DUF3131 domain-containing protein [Clostridia bacterium]
MSENKGNKQTSDFIWKSARKIRKEISSLLRFLSRHDVPSWLKTEFSLIMTQAEWVKTMLRGEKRIPYIQTDTGIIVPYAFTVSAATAPGAEEAEMIASLAHNQPDEKFLRLFPVMRAAAALCAISDHKTDVTAPSAFGQWIMQLHKTKILDWDAVHDALSQVEKSLRSDPSGVYMRSTDESKAQYRAAVLRFARRYHITEEEAAEQVLCFAGQAEHEEQKSIASWLFTQPDEKYGVFVHIGLYAASLLLGAAVFVWLFPRGIWIALFVSCFLLLPFYACLRESADIISAFFAARHGSRHPLLHLKLDSVPTEGKTLVVITTLLSGSAHDAVVFRNLERFYLRNPGENILFGILADLPVADCETQEEDEAILNNAASRIDALNRKYGGMHFVLWIRRRRYAPGEHVYMGWERKRGAVLTLVRDLRGKMEQPESNDGTSEHSEFLKRIIPGAMEMRTVQYVCTLDSDTELAPGAVLDMVSVMLHPENRPVIQNHRVIRGCAILQPEMTVTLQGASATYFTLLCAGRGGCDPYYRCETDGEELLFGAGSFCGKGLFSVDAYDAVLCDAFPTNAVLSHDFLEGARLGCRNLHTVTLSDQIPTNVLSYFERQGRWVRGDTQALRFAFSRHRNANGNVVKNPMPLSARLRVIDHVLYALIPPAVVRGVLLISFLPFGCKTAIFLWLLAFSSRLLRPILCLCHPAAWRGLFRKYHGTVLSVLQQSLLWLLFRIQLLAYEGWVNVKAVFCALWRMLVTHKHMLAWTTAGEAEAKKRAKTITGLFAAFKISVLLGLVLLFSPHWFVKIIGGFWICTPFAARFLERKPQKKQVVPVVRDTAQLRQYAEDIWRYFEDHVNQSTCYLPPDNVQWFPQTEETVAHRTSPTNIGLYLMACIAACDFGFLSPRGLYTRLHHTMETLCRMETYRGHFYNWYSTDTAEVIGERFLSTVDSGNFACTLLCAAGGALEYASEEAGLSVLAERMREMAYRMDFRFLYREKKGQLALGYDSAKEQLSVSSYDLYCSEARSAVYFAAASGQIPVRAWEALAKPLTIQDHQIGALSWSGSAFEYFMPALWLPAPENSYSAEILSFAANMQYAERMVIQSQDGIYTVFGKSEGAYFGFDADKIFQYQPCGVGRLALCADMDTQTLVMPYALFLMLGYAGEEAGRALSDLRALGMYGKYGFYEALDMTALRVGNGYAIVRSVMAHHLGMSMAALCNAVYDGIFVKRFLSDARMEAMTLLLEEQIPTDGIPLQLQAYDDITDEKTTLAHHQNIPPKEEISVQNQAQKTYAVLSNTHAYLLASSDGVMRLFDGKYAVSGIPDGKNANTAPEFLPPMVFLKNLENGRIYVPCAFIEAQNTNSTNFSFLCTDDEIRYTGSYADGITAQLSVTVSPVDSTFSFHVSLLRGDIPLPCTVTFFFRPVLYPLYAYAVHKTFSDLFLVSNVEGSLSEAGDTREIKALTFTRRARTEEERCITMVLTATGMTDVTAVTNAGALLDVGYTAADVLRLGDAAAISKDMPHLGSAVVPLAFLRGTTGGTTVLHLSCGQRAHGVLDSNLLSDLRAEHRMLCGGITPMDETVSVMVRALCENTGTKLIPSGTAAQTPNRAHGKERYWKHGISGDHPLIVIPVRENDGDARQRLIRVMNAWKYLLISGVVCDLVVTVSETDAYGKPVSALAAQVVHALGLDFFCANDGKPGRGIFFVQQKEAESDGILLCAACVFDADTPAECVYPVMPIYNTAQKQKERVVSYQMTDQNIVIEKGIQPAPWTYMLTNGVMGTLVSLDTLGFTFFSNSRECRVTPWYGEALQERCGEHLYLRIRTENSQAEDTVWYDLCRQAETVVITPYEVHYLGRIGALAYRVSVSVPDRRKRKCMRVFFQNNAEEAVLCQLRYQIEPLLGVLDFDREALSWEWNDTEKVLTVLSYTNAACAAYHIRLWMHGIENALGGQASERECYTEGSLRIPAGEGGAVRVILAIVRQGEREAAEEKIRLPRRPQSKPMIHTGMPYLDPLANTWLPMQIIGVRMYGRCGYFQPGGAYGFRDQLQDAMAAGILDAALLRAQIYRCAAHQFMEGDVQHWWHPGPLEDKAKSHRGIRSRCSDDFLWLPLAVARYLTLTGDTDILDREIRYLESPLLAEGEQERYEQPLQSNEKESLYMHCIRAIEHGMRFGAHGLPLIGSGDWNDGMNLVGVRGSGESVWGGMFLMLVLSEFLPICQARGDYDGADQYKGVIKRLASAVETEAWNGKWYRRAWYDDGTPIGNPGDLCAEIDLLPQAFAAIVNHTVRLPSGARPFDENRVHSAMLEAYSRLFDEKREVFALLSPPFDQTKRGNETAQNNHNPGYIAGYIPGTRENGGQYTHAAVWGAMGLFAVGEEEKGMRVVRAISPVRHTMTAEEILRYKKEPYALCGDVLMTHGREGEGGWSQYTGSAAWYYRLLCSLFCEQHSESHTAEHDETEAVPETV